ncbi:hypothetical protein AGMMS49959_04750 [Planctomycetales bacterium]|nr:hypothetical protein AGMMS49959_04750 [Planctomycetales bacterium]
MTIDELKRRVLDGGALTVAEALFLGEQPDKEALYAASGEVTRARAPRGYNLCCIQNAKSGKCAGDCKWCAQSAHHDCAIDKYDLVGLDAALKNLQYAQSKKIHRFSLVTSGEKLSDADFAKVLAIYRQLNAQKGECELCASLGLLSEEQLRQLKEAGMKNYHCNLETAPSFFPQVCTTHTIEDKKRTLRAALKVGLRLCCGGIIGLGETFAQRVELAFALVEFQPHSLPLNVLDPIKGTALASQPPLTEEEILTAVAIFRLVHPTAQMRFAGGRGKFSPELQQRALAAGVNAAVTEGLLTTRLNTTAADDHAMFAARYQTD